MPFLLWVARQDIRQQHLTDLLMWYVSVKVVDLCELSCEMDEMRLWIYRKPGFQEQVRQ